MTASSRAIVTLASALVVAACSTAYTPADPADAGRVDATPSADAGAGSADASDAERAPADAADPDDTGTPACTLKANGVACSASAECCSSACSNTKTCISDCTTSAACAGSTAQTCCVGHYCSTGRGDTCTPCIPFGALAERDIVTNAPIAASCCSGKLGAMAECTN